MRTFLTTAILCLATTSAFAADGCGRAFFADARGICRPNSERVVVIERPVVARPRPVIVEREVVVERRAPVEEVVVRRPVEPRCGLRVGPIAVGGPC